MTRVGYWTRAGRGGAASTGPPVIVASAGERGRRSRPRSGDRYVSEFYGLRPDVLLTLYIERGLWEQVSGMSRHFALTRTPSHGGPWHPSALYLYGFVGTGSSPAPGTRAAQSKPRWTIARASGTLKSDATWPSVVLNTRPFP